MNFSLSNFQKKIQKLSLKAKGFTLPELLVVIAIIAIITGLALANYKSYSNDAMLVNTAYDLALTVRQTQLYGISVKESTSGSGQFQNAYGIHFSSASGSYIVYQDDILPLNYYYDTANSTEFVSQNSLPAGIKFSQICSVIAGVKSCANSDDSNSSFVDIEFVRPNPDANMTVKIPGSGTITTYTPSINQNTLYGACIYLTNSSTKTQSVYIDKTGQISVNATQCN